MVFWKQKKQKEPINQGDVFPQSPSDVFCTINAEMKLPAIISAYFLYQSGEQVPVDAEISFRDVIELTLFVPEVARQHDVIAGAIALNSEYL